MHNCHYEGAQEHRPEVVAEQEVDAFTNRFVQVFLVAVDKRKSLTVSIPESIQFFYLRRKVPNTHHISNDELRTGKEETLEPNAHENDKPKKCIQHGRLLFRSFGIDRILPLRS